MRSSKLFLMRLNMLSLFFRTTTTTSNTLPNCLTTIAEIMCWVQREGHFFFLINQFIYWYLVRKSCETELLMANNELHFYLLKRFFKKHVILPVNLHSSHQYCCQYKLYPTITLISSSHTTGYPISHLFWNWQGGMSNWFAFLFFACWAYMVAPKEANTGYLRMVQPGVYKLRNSRDSCAMTINKSPISNFWSHGMYTYSKWPGLITSFSETCKEVPTTHRSFGWTISFRLEWTLKETCTIRTL